MIGYFPYEDGERQQKHSIGARKGKIWHGAAMGVVEAICTFKVFPGRYLG